MKKDKSIPILKIKPGRKGKYSLPIIGCYIELSTFCSLFNTQGDLMGKIEMCKEIQLAIKNREQIVLHDWEYAYIPILHKNQITLRRV